MSQIALGKVSATPGTPVRVTANRTDPAANLSCNSILVQTLSSSTGKVWVGSSALNKTTLVGVFAVLAIPTANSIPSFSIGNPTAQEAFNAADFYIDGESTSDGAVSTIIR